MCPGTFAGLSSICSFGSWKRHKENQRGKNEIDLNRPKRSKKLQIDPNRAVTYYYQIKNRCTTKKPAPSLLCTDLPTHVHVFLLRDLLPDWNEVCAKKCWIWLSVDSDIQVLHSVEKIQLRPQENIVRESYPCAVVPLLGPRPCAVSGPGRDTQRQVCTNKCTNIKPKDSQRFKSK